MWANMRIIVLLNCLKVGVTRSLRTRQMLKVDLCASGAGAYAPYAPPLPTGLSYRRVIIGSCYPITSYVSNITSYGRAIYNYLWQAYNKLTLQAYNQLSVSYN